MAPVLVLADEPAQWPPSTGERMVAALRTSAGKQPHFRFVALGTRPASDDHWFAKMLAGGADFAQAHAADPDDPKYHQAHMGEGEPVIGAHAGPRSGNPHRGEVRSIRPGDGPGIRRAAAQSRHRRNGDGAATGRRHMARDRGRDRSGRAVRLGFRPRDVGGAIGGRGILAGDGPARMSGGVPGGAVACRARAEGRRGGRSIRTPRGAAN